MSTKYSAFFADVKAVYLYVSGVQSKAKRVITFERRFFFLGEKKDTALKYYYL